MQKKIVAEIIVKISSGKTADCFRVTLGRFHCWRSGLLASHCQLRSFQWRSRHATLSRITI